MFKNVPTFNVLLMFGGFTNYQLQAETVFELFIAFSRAWAPKYKLLFPKTVKGLLFIAFLKTWKKKHSTLVDHYNFTFTNINVLNIYHVSSFYGKRTPLHFLNFKTLWKRDEMRFIRDLCIKHVFYSRLVWEHHIWTIFPKRRSQFCHHASYDICVSKLIYEELLCIV